MSLKPHVYHPHDEVTIVNPVIVTRVGYPLTPDSVYPTVEEALRGDVATLYRKLHDLARGEVSKVSDLTPSDTLLDRFDTLPDRDPILYQLAYRYVRLVGFGGKERSLHTKVSEELRGQKARVLSKRNVRTGSYYPPRSTGPDYNGECDYEPGGLKGAKTHVLLTLLVYTGEFGYHEDIEVEACNVQPFVAPWAADEA
jgi:hypothetical protein